MSELRRLTDEEVTAKLVGLPDWRVVDGKLHRSFEFSDFVEAFGFMTQMALLAEKLDHHPEWNNLYNRVWISMHTHDLAGISELDFELAAAADRLAS